MSLTSRRVLVVLILCILGCISAAVLVRQLMNRNGLHPIASLRLDFKDEQGVDWLRGRIMDLKGSDGLPKYPDVEVQTTTDSTNNPRLLGSRSRMFMVRLYPDDLDRLARFSSDIKKLLESESPPKPVQVITQVSGAQTR
jgi:hypothetical protein